MLMPSECVIYVSVISAIFTTVHTGKNEWKLELINLNTLKVAVNDDVLIIHHSHVTVHKSRTALI